MATLRGKLLVWLGRALIFVAVLNNGALSAAAEDYVRSSQVDLIDILAPPPAPDSAKGKADLKAVLQAQRARTPGEIRSTQADERISVFSFADVIGPAFKPEKMPFTTQLFARVIADDRHVIAPAKDYFHRPRPSITDHAIQPVVDASSASDSYPSGHATVAYTVAILLAKMLPEKAAAIFERAGQISENRVVGGVHYPTDIEAGRISGSVIANVLLHDPRFERDLARANMEVRHALGLHAAELTDGEESHGRSASK